MRPIQAHSSPQWAVAALALSVVLSSCSAVGLGGVSTTHQELDGAWSRAAVPGTVAELVWEWTAQGYSGDLEVTPLPKGVLVRTSYGVVALDGATGQERWSFTVDDEDVRALTDVSSTGERVHVMYPKQAPQEEGEAADEEGFTPAVAWRRVVLDGVSGEIVGDFEEPIAPDVERPGPFNVGVAAHAGVFHLEGSDRLSATMLSDQDGSEQWHAEDLFTCEGSKVHRADRPVAFSDAVVVRAGCGSLEAELIALDPGDGSVLWHLEGEEATFLTSERRHVRRAGELLPVYQDRGPEYQDEQFGELHVFDPASGEVVGEATGLQDEGLYLARTLEQGFLVSQRDLGADAVRYELRLFDGPALTTAHQAVETSSPGAYVLALEGAVVKFVDQREGGPKVSVAPWGGGEAFDVDVPERTQVPLSSEPRQPEGRFEAVPGAVVLVDRSGAEGEGVTVLGFGE